MKKIIEEFKLFISRGNVVDMAIGVIIATAFGKITTSLVNDVIMPVIGMIIGGKDFSQFNICIKEPLYAETGELLQEGVFIGLGTFIATIVDFVVISFIIFLIVKSLNAATDKLKKKKEDKNKSEEIKPTTEELLQNILDEIKKR